MSEKITVVCPDCSGKLAVPDTAAGKRIRCPKCQGVVPVPAAPAPRRSPGDAAGPTASRQRQKPARKTEDPWGDDNSSSNDNAGDDWDVYGTTESSRGALPPRTKSTSKSSSPPALLGTGNEPPEAEYYTAQRSGLKYNGPMITGILMMVGAAIWFFGGLAVGVIFFYPPVLFVLGLISFVKGMFGGE